MTKLNLLFIFADEQRADTMAAYGNPRMQELTARIRRWQEKTADEVDL
ncbi:MAG TPA: hypothetical protein VMX14_12000 [Anaerolineae bacterium]|nr:hypothetical protein [Anaerolineae bacterium]